MLKAAGYIALLILVVVGISSSVQALPGSGVDILYFADDTFTGDPVGEHYRDCENAHFDTGVRTGFSHAETWSCDDDEATCVSGVCYHQDENGIYYDCVYTNMNCWF